MSWQKQDQKLVSWIKSTLTEHALTQVVRLKTGFEIWKFLELQYSTRSRSRKAQLLLQLQTLRKGTSNITDYLHRAKFIADSLAAIGYPVPDEDLILAIVGGLPKSYDNLYMHVTSNSDPTSTEELQSLMLSQEVRLESQEQDDVPVNPPTTAFVATKSSSSQPPRGQSNNRSRGRGQGRSRGNFNRSIYPSSNTNNVQGSSMQSQQLAPCQIFNNVNHSALDCFYRMDHSYQGRPPPAKLAEIILINLKFFFPLIASSIISDILARW